MIDLTVVAAPLFIGGMALEAMSYRWAPDSRQRGYALRDSATSITMGLGSLVIGAVWALVALAAFGWVSDHAPLDLGAVAAGPFGGLAGRGVAAAVLRGRLLLLLVPPGAPRVPGVLGRPRTHHSSQHYNLSTAVRQPGPDDRPAVLAADLLLGYDPAQWALVHGANLLYQFWIHTERIDRLGPLEWVLNTPSHHRVHHG